MNVRGRKPNPVLADAAAMLNRQFQQQLGRLASLLAPYAPQVKAEFLKQLSELGLTAEHQESLAAITALATCEILEQGGGLDDFLEQVEYRGRRLAKLGLTPSDVVGALRRFEAVMATAARERLGADWAHLEWVHSQLHFLVVVTLNNAFYQVREAESHAFYELFRVEVESRSLDELLPKLLAVLVSYTHADAGQLWLIEDGSSRWVQAAAMPPAAAPQGTELPPARVKLLASPASLVAPESGPRPALPLDPAWASDYRTFWSVPLAGVGSLRGVIQFAFLKPYSWLPRERELLLAAAERCWMATEKAQLAHDLAVREEQVRQLAEHMVEVEESERKRISRELHDEAGQSLLCVRLQLEMLEQELTGLPAGQRQRLTEARDLVEHTIVEIRRLIAALSPAILDQMGLAAALRQLVHRFRRLHPNANIRILLPRRLELPKRVEILVYRLIQEVFNNIGKYSLARNVNLSMDSADGVLRTHVEDDGVGFDVEEAFSRRDTFGLSGMRERVALLGGTLIVKSRQRQRETAESADREQAASKQGGSRAKGVAGSRATGKAPASGQIGIERPGTAIWIELPLGDTHRPARRRSQPARPMGTVAAAASEAQRESRAKPAGKGKKTLKSPEL
jgi:signal transduction histidine kinase